jgi:hypothetical protein
MRYKVSDEEFIKIVKNSYSIAQVLKQIGLVPIGGSYSTFKKRIDRLKLDISHFTGKAHLKGKTHNWSKTKPLSEVLVKDCKTSSYKLKNRLVKEGLLKYECFAINCKISEWQNKPLALHLDHINGINDDNRLENLQLLCPNCHSQTLTYCGKNKALKNKLTSTHTYDHSHLQISKIKKTCLNCSKEINYRSTRCQQCFDKYRKEKDYNKNIIRKTKIQWLPISELLELLKTHSYCALGRMLGVSDSAIRKHIKNHQ